MDLVAGVGSAPITPPTPVALAGFGEPQLATEVHDGLEARALYLASGPVAVCLVVCDLLGMSYEFGGPARAAVAAAVGLDPAAVLVACTHTHAGPSAMAGTAALGWPTPEGYGALLADGCASAARSAKAVAVSVEARHVRSPLPHGLSRNRRGHPYDPWFSVLDFVSPDARVATLANLAIHPVALGPECLAVSTDWVGPFRSALATRAGGAPVMLSGALGDVNPVHVHRQGNDCRSDGFDEAARLGSDVAEVVDAVLGDGVPLDGGLRVVAERRIEVPIGGTALASARGGDTMPVDLVEWALGPVRIVSVPGEAFHAFGREVEASRDHRVLLAGLSPLWQGYLPVPFEEGGYEEGVSYGPRAVRAILDALLDVPV